MSKADFFITAAAVCLGAFIGTSLTTLAHRALNSTLPAADVVSDQSSNLPSLEELYLRDVARSNFDVDVSEEYKRGWRDCCEFLVDNLINARLPRMDPAKQLIPVTHPRRRLTRESPRSEGRRVNFRCDLL